MWIAGWNTVLGGGGETRVDMYLFPIDIQMGDIQSYLLRFDVLGVFWGIQIPLSRGVEIYRRMLVAADVFSDVENQWQRTFNTGCQQKTGFRNCYC